MELLFNFSLEKTQNGSCRTKNYASNRVEGCRYDQLSPVRTRIFTKDGYAHDMVTKIQDGHPFFSVEKFKGGLFFSHPRAQ